MSNRRGLRGLLSPRSTGTPLEALEQRALLTVGPLPADAAMLDWGGSHLVVRPGSYVLTFDSALGSQQAELLAREVATRLGVNGTDFQSVGRGHFYKAMTPSKTTASGRTCITCLSKLACCT